MGIVMGSCEDRTPQAWDMLTIPFPGPSHMRGPENEMHEHAAFINNKHIVAYSALLTENNIGYPVFLCFEITDVGTIAPSKRLKT
jgi:hypothetical protein